MPVKTPSATARALRIRRFSAAGLVTAGAAAAALSMAPTAHADEHASPVASAASVSAASITDQAHRAAPSAQKDAADKKDDKKYADNLDGWIRESLDIMDEKGIPGSYEGLHKNIMRESEGDPDAQNGWDVNAQQGTPSKGLLQVIQPTFDAYHVAGTEDELTDPVANITAAANYAADRYGSIDNVNSAY